MPGYPDWLPPGPTQREAGSVEPVVGYPDWEPPGIVSAGGGGGGALKMVWQVAGLGLEVKHEGSTVPLEQSALVSATHDAMVQCHIHLAMPITGKGQITGIIEVGGFIVAERQIDGVGKAVNVEAPSDDTQIMVPVPKGSILTVKLHIVCEKAVEGNARVTAQSILFLD